MVSAATLFGGESVPGRSRLGGSVVVPARTLSGRVSRSASSLDRPVGHRYGRLMEIAGDTRTVSTAYGEVVVHLSGRSPGDASGLLLLHANPGDHRDFDPIAATLGEAWSIAAVDWPGYGGSSAADGLTVDALADVAYEVVESLSDSGFRSFTVLGNSVGAYAAVRLAQRAGDRIRGLVLVQSAGFVPLNLLTRALFRVMAHPAVARWAVVPCARMYLGSARHEGVRPILERAKGIPRDPVRLAVYRRLWRSLDDPRLDLPADGPLLPELPILAVWGRRDPMNPWLLNRRGLARALPHAEIALLDARHEPFAERPAEFLGAVSEFLAARAEASS
ncbi:alpha/beta fold hydrolase [Nocardia puris]|uniref:alpha/beta fold hydrolase n=1 Tax=Nocardia puris TaxID=208602 RepID=UPI0018935104|nr:alpha/beta fold hydrolase [Nocardia puris]MBF6215164.1 alpha/beta fold hydrolase [Nocardia puris]